MKYMNVRQGLQVTLKKRDWARHRPEIHEQMLAVDAGLT